MLTFVNNQAISVDELHLTAPPNIREIEALDSELRTKFGRRLRVETQLTRQLVSFQANKSEAFYRWYKYKEGFSAALVALLADTGRITSGKVLDPFAGAGTTLFASRELGLDCDGIELLPLGCKVIEARLLASAVSTDTIDRLNAWLSDSPWLNRAYVAELPQLRITRGAYPDATGASLARYLSLAQNESPQVATILVFAALCVLESVSYTRKDGQYLRWDSRSERGVGDKVFDKGEIRTFDDAIREKLSQILTDIATGTAQESLFRAARTGRVNLIPGSCLEILPSRRACEYSAIITSPPYCNRYDYTRTYALELAALGVDENQLSSLRQRMLSCTVENRPKDLVALNPRWSSAIVAADQQPLLQAILSFLDAEREAKRLNNGGIARMVRGYFYEMSCFISEAYRVLMKGGQVFMVNDNVRYAGVSISVDLILSSIAESLGFQAEEILVLPSGKGNSSQQMGEHGRDQLRKCVYIWRKVN